MFRTFYLVPVILGFLLQTTPAFSQAKIIEPSEFSKMTFKGLDGKFYSGKHVEKMACRKFEGGNSYKVMSSFFKRKGGATVLQFFEFAICKNKTGIDQDRGMKTIPPMFMIVFKPAERITFYMSLIDAGLVITPSGPTYPVFSRILDRRDQFGRNVLDFLEEQVNEKENGIHELRLYNKLRARMCKPGVLHTKPEYKGRCSEEFLLTREYP